MDKRLLDLHFSINDYEEKEYPETMEYSKTLSVNEEGIAIEDFFDFCYNAARAIGFGQKTVEEWFGNY